MDNGTHSAPLMNNFIRHKSGSNKYKNKQTNITKLKLSEYNKSLVGFGGRYSLHGGGRK